MENTREIREMLNKLYDRKGEITDSFLISERITKTLQAYLEKMVIPLPLSINSKFSEVEFDARVDMGRRKSLLVEIITGSPSDFRFRRLEDLIKTMETKYYSNIYVLVIAHNFSQKSRKNIKELENITKKGKIKVGFINFNTFINLYEKTINEKVTNKEAKIAFFEALFSEDPLIVDKTIDNSLMTLREANVYEKKRLNLEKWLKTFEQEIEDAYEKRRMDNVLSSNVKIVDKAPTQMLMLDEPIKVHSIGKNGKLPPPTMVSLRRIEPKQIRITCPLGEWASAPNRYYMGILLEKMGEIISQREYEIIVNSLIKFAAYEIKTTSEDPLGKESLQKAQNQITKSGFYANILIVPWNLARDLWIKQLTMNASNLPVTYLAKNRQRNDFSGLYQGLYLFSSKSLHNESLLFSRNELFVRKTPHHITFDDETYPTKLYISKEISSAPIVDQAVAKIKMSSPK